MLHLVPLSRTPFENPDDPLYSRMAFDGMYFYCCTGKSNKILKLTIEGKLKRCLDTKRAYCAICFDDKETCFWAIATGCRSTIYQLDACLCEIGCVSFPCQDRWYHNISYDVHRDSLLLCGSDLVVNVSKSGFLLPLYHGEKNVQQEAVIPIFDRYLIGCKFPIGCPDILGILEADHSFDYLTCMPKQFALNSICVGYQGGRSTLFILASKNYRYSYLMTYRIERDEKCEKNGSPTCNQPIDDDQMIRISRDEMDVRADIVISMSEVG